MARLTENHFWVAVLKRKPISRPKLFVETLCICYLTIPLLPNPPLVTLPLHETGSVPHTPTLCVPFQMPRPTFHPSRNPILLIAVVERDPSLQLKHLITPNLPSNHPNVLAAKAALSSAPDFIFPSQLPSPHFSPPPIHSPTPSPSPTPPQSPHKTPTHLPLSSSAAYFALAQPIKSSYKPSVRPPSRTFSNLSSLNNIFPSTPTILRRPSSSPSQHSSHLPSSHHSSESHRHQCLPALEASNRLFRTTFLSCPSHVFVITAKDGSRNYAYCRPLSSTTAVLLLSSVSHTSVYVSALESAAITYHNLVDQAITHLTVTTSPCVCSVFIATTINRCPKHIATNLAATLLDSFSCPAFASPNHTCQHQSNPALSTSSLSSSVSPINRSKDPLTDLDDLSAPCLASSTSPFLKPYLAAQDPHFPLHQMSSAPDNHFTKRADVSPSVCPVTAKHDTPDSSIERVIELADATLLLRHFSIRSLLSIIVALLEERRVCFVGPNTALVSRTVLAIDNFIRPFEWPHLISPILLAHMLPVLGAPFPYLVGILEDHFAATSQLPLEDVVFADISTGKVTCVEGLGELYRHIPRRIRGRLERRLTRAKISCTRQVLRSRPSLLFNATNHILTSAVDMSDESAFSINKKDKPRLMRRSRSYSRFNEASPHNIWMEYETTLIIDKAMQRFFAELLDGNMDMRDTVILNKHEGDTGREGLGQTLPHLSSPPLTSRSLTRRERDSDKNHLAIAFQDTQMFMQWRDLALQESLTPFPHSETRSQRGGLSRKRSKDRDSSARKLNTEVDEDNAAKDPKFKVRVTSDMEDVFSGEEGATEDSGAERKRFRSKGKSSRRQGVRLQSALGDAKHDISSPSLTSHTVGSDLSEQRVPLKIASESDDLAGHPQIRLSAAELDIESAPRRPWFSLRLTSATWSTAREWATVAAQEREAAVDRYDQFSDGEETDPFDEAEENAINSILSDDMSSSEHVGIGWSRMRQWSKRMNRRSARV